MCWFLNQVIKKVEFYDINGRAITDETYISSLKSLGAYHLREKEETESVVFDNFKCPPIGEFVYCKDCGAKLAIGEDISLSDSADSRNTPCPKCGGHLTKPKRTYVSKGVVSNYYSYRHWEESLENEKTFYREIWKSMDDRNKTNE